MVKEKKLGKRKGLKQITFGIKYRIFKKKITLKEYKIAEDYLSNQIDLFTMEKDLLLRGLSHAEARRIADTYEYLRWLTNLPPVKLITEDKLKGGILDGIRRSE